MDIKGLAPNAANILDASKSKLILGQVSEINPVVSIVMPVYNHPDFLKKSVMSVVSQKTDFPYEVIVVDNNHPELQRVNQEIIASIGSNKLRYYVNDENLRFCGNCNMGIVLARGKYVMFCHDDDLLTENALQTLMDIRTVVNSSDCAIIGNIDKIDEFDKPIKNKNHWDYSILSGKSIIKLNMYDFLYSNYTNGCGAMYNRENLLSIGGFNQDYSPCADYQLNVYYSLKYGSYFIRQTTLLYRVSPQSDSSTAYKRIEDMDRRIKNDILSTSSINHLFPRKLIDIKLKADHFRLYSDWSSNSINSYMYFIPRVINRCWLLLSLIGKRRRAVK